MTDRQLPLPRHECLIPIAVLAVVAGLIPVPATAVNSTLDYQDARQSGRTDAGAFSSYWRRGTLSLQQVLLQNGPLTVDSRFWAVRETTGSDATGTTQESMRRSYQPEGTVSVRTHLLQTGLKGNWFQRHAEGATELPSETNREQWSAWLEARLTPSTQFASSLTNTHSEDDLDQGTREQNERNGYLRARQALPETFQFEYLLNGTSSDLNVDDTKRTFLSHGFELRGSPGFGGNRLRTNMRARSLFLDQKVEVGPGAGSDVYLEPLDGTVVLDDTPETLDPLEDQPRSVPALFDRDRGTATSINVGDSAPVVREFGGDYRNIAYDFGDVQDFASMFLFVDQRLTNPELFRWRIFVTDDPDGRLWEELGPARVQVTYQELGTIVHGWQVTFADGVSGRFVKMVDVKFGTTPADVFVTEMEVFVRGSGDPFSRDENSQDHRLEARAAYDLAPSLEVAYETRLRTRRFDDDSRNVDETDHGVRSTWTRSAYVFSGRVDVQKRDSPSNRRDTDVTTYQLSASRRRVERLSGTLSWNRAQDSSAGRDRTTDSFGADAGWRAAPGLRFDERVAYGHRHDAVLDTRGSAVSVSHRVEAAPVPSFAVDLSRTDRWVDEELGSGFQRFSDTAAEATWSPVPLVTASSEFRVQERREREWTTRHSVTWRPFATGNLRPMLAADTYYDSRFDSWEPGASVSARWFVRRGLTAEGRVGFRRFEIAGSRTAPVDTQVHVTWSP